jgi:curli biogenesis system outer membrane secretion channel CsgG
MKAITLAAVILIVLAISSTATSTVFKGKPAGGGEAAVVSSVATLPPLKGPKKTIAVGSFENKAGWRSEWNLSEGMEEMLTTSLVQTNRFTVLERPEVEKFLEEQDFGASDRTTKEGGAKIGKVLRAQILVSGAITEFSSKVDETGIGLSTDKFGGALKQQKAHVAINLRMYDTTTGEVLFSERVEGKATATGVAVDYQNRDFGIGGGKFWATPLGEATQECINNAVFFIASKMRDVQWQGSIVKADDAKVYINAGSQAGITVGDSFVIYSKGEELVDPETGITLGSEEEKAGRITVVSVKEKYSVATIDEGEEFKRGDIVRLK